MDTAIVSAARAQFTFTVMYHYLFPILTMGLSVLIAALKTVQFFRKDDRYGAAARFWMRIFAINFAMGVVTGIPMEFQFGTNWADFSAFAGGVIGQPLAMEGAYAFFLESGFLGLFLFGERRVSPFVHWLSSVLIAVGTLLSGYFIIATNAFMQHPVGYAIGPDGALRMDSLWKVLTNPFAEWQYAHAIMASLGTAAIVMAGTGAFYALNRQHHDFARISLRVGILAGFVFSVLQVFPTGDMNGANVSAYQPEKLAAMEGLFESQKHAPLTIIGMPDEEQKRLIDPVYVPGLLSFLAYGSSQAAVKGIDEYPPSRIPPISVTYYAYHIMVGLGTIFILVTAIGLYLLGKNRLIENRWFLWILMLLIPFPYIANEAGWTVTEAGRQPWLIYGLQLTAQGVSQNVSAGETLFTLLGFGGIYCVLSLLFLFLIFRRISIGPEQA